MRARHVIGVLTVAILAGGTIAPQPAASQARIERLSGPDRIATAAAIASFSWFEGPVPHIVFARADSFADAIAAAPLAASAPGPLLLTDSMGIPERIRDTFDRRGALGVYLAGGVTALSPQVEADAHAWSGGPVTRLHGSNRWATAVAIAQATTTSPAEVYVADGSTFAEALLAGSWAGTRDGVLVLTAGTVLPVETENYLASLPASTRVIAVGTSAASATDGWADEAVVGVDPYDLSVQIARRNHEDASTTVAIASGESFPDALAGGAHAAQFRYPLLLVRPDEAPAQVVDYVAETGFERVLVYGGTAAVSQPVAEAVAGGASPAPTAFTTCEDDAAGDVRDDYGNEGLDYDIGDIVRHCGHISGNGAVEVTTTLRAGLEPGSEAFQSVWGDPDSTIATVVDYDRPDGSFVTRQVRTRLENSQLVVDTLTGDGTTVLCGGTVTTDGTSFTVRSDCIADAVLAHVHTQVDQRLHYEDESSLQTDYAPGSSEFMYVGP